MGVVSRCLYKYVILKISSFPLSTMADSFSYVWMACLSDSLARDVLRRARAKCAGCQSGMSSPMLHKHETQNLLEKFEENFEEARLYTIGIIPKLYNQFQHLLPHSTDLEKDKQVYEESANCFLLAATSRSIYYGQFVNGATDKITRDAFKPIRRTKRPRNSKFQELLDFDNCASMVNGEMVFDTRRRKEEEAQLDKLMKDPEIDAILKAATSS